MPTFVLIAPKPHWHANSVSMSGEDGLAIARVAPVGIATVAAMAPAGIICLLHDEELDPVDFDVKADFIGISANVSQAHRAIEIAKEFRSRGRTVIIGGPHITLDPARGLTVGR